MVFRPKSDRQFWSQLINRMIVGLNEMPKLKELRDQMKEGELVIILGDKHTSNEWPVGRIIEILPTERDGITRLYKVKYLNNEIYVIAEKLAPLFI